MSQPAINPPKKPRTVSLPLTIIIAVFVGLVGFVSGTRSDEFMARFSGKTSPSSLDFSSLNDVYSVLRDKYDGTLDTQALIDGAKHGLVEATGDPYTSYFTTKEAEQFQDDLEGSFQGIGAELGKRNDQLVIISTLDDSPAKKIGLLANDVIVKVNSEDASNWTVEQAVSKIRGEKGTTVKLTVYRGEAGLKELSITRAAITNPSVKSEITPDGVGILRISRFGESDTATLSRKAAEQFRASGAKAVILDMRGNGGGYLSAARDVSSLWLHDKVVVTERANGKVVDTLRSGNDAPLAGIKTVVLVDGGSASASEIVAGALADNGAATLVGEKTFGKGSVQVIQDVKTGGKLKITVAKWYTPSGKNINKEGITPSVVVGLTPEDVNANRDPQKDKALELVR
jgi:carboxyl-terminal processing protease